MINKKLFTAIVLSGVFSAGLNTTALAATEWPDPELQTTTLDLENGGTYYFYLRKANMFLVNGNNWNLQTSLGAEGKIIKVSKVTDETMKLTGWALEMPDAEANNGGKPKYLYTKDGQNSYVDYNMEGSYLWKITKNADGNTYRIKILDEDPNYGVKVSGGAFANCYMGWDGLTTESGTMSNTIIRPFINPEGLGYENAAIDWEVANEYDYAVFIAKKDLKSALEYAVNVGFTDYSQFETVYNDPSATDYEVMIATEKLQALTDTYYYSQASEDNPLDLTFMITNANFPDGDKSGWDNNMDMSRTAETDKYYNEAGELMFRYAEKWVAGGNKLGDVYIRQTLKNMPEGKYRLTADVIGYQQIDNQLATGIYLFANGGFNDITKETGTKEFDEENRAIAHNDTLNFTVLGDGTVTIGFRTVSTTANWVAVDNFKLTYYGNDDNLAQQTVRETLDKLTASWSDLIEEQAFICSQAIENKYNIVIEEANATLAASVEQDSLISLNKRLLAVIDELKADVDAYNRVNDVLEEAMLATVWYSDETTGYTPYLDYEAEFTKTNEYYGMIETQVSERTFVPDSINTIQTNITKLFKEDLYVLVQNKTVTDLYGLLSSPDFTDNKTSGWNGNPSASYNVAEKYFGSAGIQSFDVYQELKGVPNGTYLITMKGFCRPVSYDSFTTAWETDPAQTVQAYLYGNTSSVLVKHVLSEGSDQPYITNSDGNTNDKQTAAVEGKYFANDLASAEKAFSIGQYVNTLQCVVTDGVLRFGVKMNTENGSSGNWTTFDEFRVNYLGEDANAYLTALTELKDEVFEYYNQLVSDLTGITLDASNELNNALIEAEDLINSFSTDVARITASMDRLKAAKANAETSVKAVEDLSTLVSKMYDKADELEMNGYNSDELFNLCDEVDIRLNENNLASIAEINEYTIKLHSAVTKAIMNLDANGASEDNPADVTAVLTNPGFSKVVDGVETNTDEGWTMEKDGGSNTANYSEFEFWNNNSYKLYQTLFGLPAGQYRIECSGFYRAGSYFEAAAAHRDSVEQLNALLFAGLESIPLQSLIADGSEKPVSADDVNVADSLSTGDNPINYWYIPNSMASVQSALTQGRYNNNSLTFRVKEGDTAIELGILKNKHIESDWTIVDSFRLYYYGEVAETPEEQLTYLLKKKYADAKAWSDTVYVIQQPTYEGIHKHMTSTVDSVYDVTINSDFETTRYQTAINEIDAAWNTAKSGNELACWIEKCKYAIAARPDTTFSKAIDAAMTVVENARNNTAETYDTATIELMEAYDEYMSYTPEISLTIHVDQPGTLAEKIKAQTGNEQEVTELILSGTMDEADFEYIRSGLSNVKTVNLYDVNVTTLPEGAFGNAQNLQTCILPKNLKFIGKYAFCECPSLTELTIPESVLSCGSEAFSYSSNLTKITCLSACPPVLIDGDYLAYSAENIALYVPYFAAEAYGNAKGWKDFGQIMGIAERPSQITVHQDITLNIADTLTVNDLSLIKFEDENYGTVSQGILTVNGKRINMNKYKMTYDYYTDFNSANGTNNHNVLINNAEISADSVEVNLNLYAGKWAFLSFPYDVKVSDIKPLYENAAWVIRKYDGAARAARQMDNTWVNMTEDSILHAGVGYIWQSAYLNSDNNTFAVPAMDNAGKNLIFANSEHVTPLAEYTAESANDCSWNLVGNPFPSYYDTRWIKFNAPITVWNARQQTYDAYSLTDDAYILRPGEAFFVQRPNDMDNITFPTEGRLTTNVVEDTATIAYANMRTFGSSQRRVFNLYLTDGNHTDRTRFVINDLAGISYDINTDAGKFMSTDKTVAQLYTIENGMNLSINERPLGTGLIALGAYFGETGSYTLKLDSKSNTNVYLVDRLTGEETNLADNAYTFEAEAGTDTGRFMIKLENEATGIESAITDEIKVTAANGRIYVKAPHSVKMSVYAVDGSEIGTKEAVEASFNVTPGVYVVKVQNATYKVTVKR